MFGARYYGNSYYGPRYWGNGAVAPIEVPNVANELQADGTTTLEGEGFVVAVATAYSSTVPAGTIISQDPVGGSFALPGSTVTITVSLGEAPPVEEGGGGPDKSDSRNSEEFWYWLQRARAELKRQAEQRLAIREQAEAIPDKTDREIAVLLKKQVAKDEERAELTKLQQFADVAKARNLAPTPEMQLLIERAATARTNTALLNLQREMARMDEEEEALVLALASFLLQ